MSVVNRRNAAVIGGLVLLCSLGFAGWTQLISGTTNTLNSVCFPSGTQVGYAVGLGGTILKTTDGGTTWTAESSHTGSTLNSVFFNDNNTGFAVGSRGKILKTANGGTTWDTTHNGTYPLTYVSFPSKGQTGWIGVNHTDSLATVLKSTDGGGTWTSILVGGHITRSYSAGFATDNNGVVLGYAGPCYGTTNGGDSFKAEGAWNSHANWVAAAASPTSHLSAYLVGIDETLGQGCIRYTAAFPPTLWDTTMVYPVVSAFHGVTFANDNYAYICGDNGFIGVTIVPYDLEPTSTPGITGAVNGLSFPSADTGFAVGEAGMILKTTDGGRPWPGVAEGKVPATLRAGIRVLSNPCRYGIAVHADARVPVTVFDATGRAVLNQTATAGFNLLPVRKAGAYFVKSGTQTARAVVTD